MRSLAVAYHRQEAVAGTCQGEESRDQRRELENRRAARFQVPCSKSVVVTGLIFERSARLQEKE